MLDKYHPCYTFKSALSIYKMALKLRNIHVCQKTWLEYKGAVSRIKGENKVIY